ncbi:glycosyltransferase involved in cell wall biosynthesis [Arthrobacter sp. CAN_A6]|uniref:glycosyltransferase family 4 protein n=1 Tax=Arthrobacter sp. CAN_A6 TaxID=2787721 RepID=UPI001A33518F
MNVPKDEKKQTDSSSVVSEPRLRILHFGFEDPMMPGAGGGSVRTHEINKRIAACGHSVTVLTTRYPYWIARNQDGVQYVPIGFGQGRTRLSRLLGYCLRLPWETWKRRPSVDLVVEDFFAPFSTMAAPLWTGKPTIGMVQWLHAREKSREYKLPFHWIERAGVRRHRHLIAVSNGTGDQLRKLNPAVTVDVIGNGIDMRALEIPQQLGTDIVCIGRLEFVGKGLDLLLKAWAQASEEVEGNLIIAGTGPGEQQIRDEIAAGNLGSRVRLTGWKSGQEKSEMLAAARLVVIPSRAETFGLVAVEALASGTPVIAFDIPCLREVVPPGCGWLVPPFDVDGLADEMCRQYSDPTGLAAAGAAGRRFASGFDWDGRAVSQVDAYYAALPDSETLTRSTRRGR